MLTFTPTAGMMYDTRAVRVINDDQPYAESTKNAEPEL